MKKIGMILLVLAAALSSNAQGVINSIFRQKATARKYNIEQLALLTTLKGYLSKGYKIATGGLNEIGGITRGEYDLHGEYISSLKNVNPVVKKYYRVPDIIAMQLKTLQIYTATCRQAGSLPEFSADENTYVREVFRNVLRNCNHIIDELTELTTSGVLEMKDDERLKRIENLYNDMLNMLSFAETFSMEARQLGFSRTATVSDSLTMKGLYESGTKNGRPE